MISNTTKLIILICLLVFQAPSYAQFSNGLNEIEAQNLMKLSYYPFFMDSCKTKMDNELPNYQIIKTVDSVAMDNAWSIIKTKNTGIITFRGTTVQQISWMENFYSAMIPAKGEATIPSGKTITYNFANDERAGVQSGWSLAILIMSPEIIEEIKKLNNEGIYHIYIAGHSQGGALALLFRAFLEHLPNDVLSEKNTYKTYAFAAPKPGNRFFAYEYNKIANKELTSFTFTNPYDWVPQLPFSVQSPNNITALNPFIAFESSKEGSFIKRIALHQIYNSMKKPIVKSQKSLNKNLGDRVSKLIKKDIGEFTLPPYLLDAAYFPVGVNIVLEQYQPIHNPKDKKDVFWQHHPPHYIQLVTAYFE